MTSVRHQTRHFVDLTEAPLDPVFGLAELFRQDTRPHKVNLTVGAYQNELGQTPVLACVKEVEARLVREQKTKNYLPIDGLPKLRAAMQSFILGEDHESISACRAITIQTPGGTGALRLAAEFVRLFLGSRAIWMSDPTWANHPQIFQAAGFELRTYHYLNGDQTGIDVPRILEQLDGAQPGDVVLLHTICHNPTGFDFDREDWVAMLELMERRGLLPLFDFAYQGFGEDVDRDAWPVRHFCRELPEVLICNSFSKNMGLYSERVGGLTLVLSDAATSQAALSHVKQLVRTMYSTPSEHGGAIAEAILTDESLRREWLEELAEMRQRIHRVRQSFVHQLSNRIPQRDFSFMLRQRGMFSYAGLTRQQVIRLREEHAIYLVESGRINIAGINERNVEMVAAALAKVL